MEGGMPSSAASSDPLEPEINAAVEPGREVLELVGQISAETVGPLVARLEQAKPAEKLLVYIRANGGGCTASMFELIEGLAASKADVELAINRYAMSAAATLWLWFILDPIEGEAGVGRVVSVGPLKPTVLLIHRPRLALAGDGTYYCFLDGVADEGMRQELSAQLDVFDDIFDRLMERLGINDVHAALITEQRGTFKHHLHYAKDAYYGNCDYVLTLEG